MDVWEAAVAKSTAPPGSDFWTHLTSPAPGGGGGVGTIYGETVAQLMADVSVSVEDEHVVMLEDNYLSVEIAGDIVVDCE